MASQRGLQVACTLAIVFLLVGIVCYAAFPAKNPGKPLRIMFKSMAGKILFDHKTHESDSGYGIACMDCHHNLEEGETDPEKCGECHETESDDEEVLKRADAFHSQCIGCHKQEDAGPVKCEACHVM